jgi:hypothetical protein
MNRTSARRICRSTTVLTMLLSLMLAACDSSDDNDGAPSDTTNPTASLTTAAGTVSRTVTLQATATDDIGVAQVRFIVDDLTVATDTTAPYEAAWNSGTVTDGEHTLRAEAEDAAGNVGTSAAVTLLVANELELAVVLTSSNEVPANGSTASGTATLQVNAGSGAIGGSLDLLDVVATAAHVHRAYAGANGPVLIELTADPAVAGRLNVPAGSTLTAEQVDALLDGELYLNAHSAAFPNGEIRGQILPAGWSVVPASLTGREQVPLLSTPITGSGALTIDPATRRVHAHVSLVGLDDATAAHVHRGIAGTNGAVIVSLAQDPNDPSHWFANGQVLSEEDFAALGNAELYLNVHSNEQPNGVVRAQLVPAGRSLLIAELSGTQQVPAITIDAGGSVALTLDDATRDFVLHVNATGVDDAVAAHIHGAYAGANGAVLIDLTHDASDPTHWSASGTLDESQAGALAAGALYVNVHTPAEPNGAVRAQLLPPSVEVIFADLDGTQVVPPVVTAATARLAATTDLVTRAFLVNGYSQNFATATSGSVREGAAGTNGPQVVELEPNDDLTLWSSTSLVLDEDQFSSYLAGELYAVLASATRPDGEIRGQFERKTAPPPDTTAPTVTLTAPAGPLSGTVMLTATATDDVGVTAVRFFVEGTQVGSDAAAPYEFSWDTTTVADGAITLHAEASDAAGNDGRSADVDVTVTNAVGITFAQIQSTVFTPRCSGCHTGPTGNTLPSGMNLSSAAASYAALVGVASLEVPSLDRVAPGNPDDSYLIQKLEGTAAEGVRMPQGGPFLDQATIDQIRDWITSGAPNN